MFLEERAISGFFRLEMPEKSCVSIEVDLLRENLIESLRVLQQSARRSGENEKD
jgi:hypothetical protein